MTMELRILGWLQGLMLGLILAAPLLSPAYMPWGVQMLFALSAFQLRQADRRWALRPGMTGWVSHIRMAPSRMLPWAASAVVAFIADGAGAAFVFLGPLTADADLSAGIALTGNAGFKAGYSVNGPGDLDGDGVCATSDLLIFLTVFGSGCD